MACNNFFQLRSKIMHNKLLIGGISGLFQNANLPENRMKHPWILIFGHRGMYCSPGWWDCAKPTARTRIGIPIDGTLK